MRIYPAIHYTMGGLWVDYNLMSNVPGLYVFGEANFSDHGANRLGASALMQGLADGYFVIPYTIGDYLAGLLGKQAVPTDAPEFKAALANVADQTKQWLSTKGTKSVDYYHRELGKIMWEYVRHGPQQAGSRKGDVRDPRGARRIPQERPCVGSGETLNQSLEKAGVSTTSSSSAISLPRCARARRVLRRTLPRGASDRRRRSGARRRSVRPRRRMGMDRRRYARDPASRRAGVRERQARSTLVQVRLTTDVETPQSHAQGLAPGWPRSGRALRDIRRSASARTRRSSRCSMSSTSA